MCGIAGFLNLSDSGRGRETAARMAATLRHRGPDGSGVHIDGPAALAHARLSIIDLGGGGQPMSNEDGSVWITFNGEIFNYLELREELLECGHQFRTVSDTEVIVHLYEEEGERCVERFNGQWAFAIWDSRRRRLFLSRDRFGVRPLFHARTAKGDFVFASEVKALFAHPDMPRELDREGLDQVFTYWTTLPPRTVFQGIRELPPGHSMSVDATGIGIRPYWRLRFAPQYEPAAEANQREDEYAERLLSTLTDAVRIRLRADVPVGAYLSGGLDSTVTTALIRRVSNCRLRTFSIGFEDPEFDESAWQGEAVRYLATDHQRVSCNGADIARVFPDVIWHAEKPVLRTAPAPMYMLAKLVRQSGYKVVVTGEGADETLGGYDIFKEAKIRRFWARHPESRLRPLLLRRLYPYLPNLRNQPDAYRRAFFHVRPEDLASPVFSHLPRWELTARIRQFYSRDMQAESGGRTTGADLIDLLPEHFARWDSLSQAQYLEAAYLLPGYILSSQGDRMAMAHSVEGRFPFLDVRVAELAASLPPSLRMKVLDEKYLLKKCSASLIPPAIRKRSKQPYRAPEGKSFFADEQNGYVAEMLSEERVIRAGVFNPAAVTALAAKVRRGEAIGIKDNMAFVGVLSTQILIHKFCGAFSGSE